jgi:hypothetical protein
MTIHVERHFGCRVVDGEVEDSRKLRGPDGVNDVAFSARELQRGTEKLYVVERNGEFCYVGRTGTSVQARIQGGLNARYPYRWRRCSYVDLCICLLGCKANRDYGEGVEAELVHLLRLGERRRAGKWPSDQHEIHFRHTRGEPNPKCVSAARDIYRKLTGK